MDEHRMNAALLLENAEGQDDWRARQCLIDEALVHAVLHLGEMLALRTVVDTHDGAGPIGLCGWHVARVDDGGVQTEMPGQPAQGFAGPGAALRWYEGQEQDTGRLGSDTFIRRDDGESPCGPNVHRQKARHAH